MADKEQPASAGAPPTDQPVASNPVGVGNKKYVVKTPWTIDFLQGNGAFPDITPAGVGMTETELNAANEAAGSLHIRLNVEEAK